MSFLVSPVPSRPVSRSVPPRRCVRTKGLVETMGVLSTGVLVHESGHLLAAKWRDVRVDRVSIGIGPILTAFSDGDDVPYLLRAFPFGGYVSVNMDDASTMDKIIVALGGPLANILCTVLISSMVAMTMGHVSIENGFVIDRVVAGTEASRAGLMEGDVIRTINGHEIVPTKSSYHHVMTEFETSPDVEITFSRGTTLRSTTIQPTFGRPGFEVSPNTETTRLSPPGALRRGWKDAMTMTKAVATGLVEMVRPMTHGDETLEYLPDPGSVRDRLRMVQLVNTNIAVIMASPIPPMDGFWILVYMAEGLARRTFDRRILSRVGDIGTSFLFAVFMLSILQDLLL